ncbi:MAG: sigma-70 family RNA polymerase sigma factor [Kiritimatiellaceae bacterium]|nr:sigma-70 family RNA polymerase sigma factor [Kiritimatiellaceae bacterium]
MSDHDSSATLSAYHTRESLLLRLKEGANEEVWQDFYDIYGRLIFGYSLHFDISYSEAEDIVQEVCIKVFRQIMRFDYSRERGRFRGWLKTITHNAVIDYLRRKQNRSKTSSEYRKWLEQEEEAAEGDDQIWRLEWEKAVFEMALDRVRERVGEETIRIFLCYVLEARSAAEVADETTLDANAIYAVKHRVLKFIREEVAIIMENERGVE